MVLLTVTLYMLCHVHSIPKNIHANLLKILLTLFVQNINTYANVIELLSIACKVYSIKYAHGLEKDDIDIYLLKR